MDRHRYSSIFFGDATSSDKVRDVAIDTRLRIVFTVVIVVCLTSFLMIFHVPSPSKIPSGVVTLKQPNMNPNQAAKEFWVPEPARAPKPISMNSQLVKVVTKQLRSVPELSEEDALSIPSVAPPIDLSTFRRNLQHDLE